jgi:hypothetical protein
MAGRTLVVVNGVLLHLHILEIDVVNSSESYSAPPAILFQ